jgi:hypothetical protein
MSEGFVEGKIKTAASIKDSQDNDVFPLHRKSDRCPPLEADRSESWPYIITRRASSWEWGQRETKALDSAGVGACNFDTSAFSNPGENLIEIGPCPLTKDNAGQRLSSRFF